MPASVYADVFWQEAASHLLLWPLCTHLHLTLHTQRNHLDMLITLNKTALDQTFLVCQRIWLVKIVDSWQVQAGHVTPQVHHWIDMEDMVIKTIVMIWEELRYVIISFFDAKTHILDVYQFPQYSSNTMSSQQSHELEHVNREYQHLL